MPGPKNRSQPRIRLLGPVEMLRPDGVVVPIGAAKRRSVLAALALELNQIVSADRLMDIVWDGHPPPTAKAALQGHIAQLRKELGDGVELITRTPGYQLLAHRWQLDVTRFEDYLAEAGRSNDADAVELLRTALELRRGPALADINADQLRQDASDQLAESVVTAMYELARRLYRLGRATEGIAPLQEAITLRPLREPLVELLVLSLHQAGRQAEALDVYHEMRARLADELGVTPGAGLQRACQTVLDAQDEPEPATVPAQLPRQNSRFVGRDAELAQLHASRNSTIRIVTGPAGSGKTALALRWAHQVAPDFPDGRLFADLRGFHAAEPADPGRVLGGFLRALGVPDQRIPADLDERAALYRSVLAGKRVLVVLDNAHTAAQVRPLLPGHSGCAVVVSSRSRLDDLAATEDAVLVAVGSLSPQAAIALFGLVTGNERPADPVAAAEAVELCDRLPLALRIAATRAAGLPQLTPRTMVDLLADEQYRLARLSMPGTGMRTALASSYRRLDATSARVFRMLAMHPGNDIDGFAAAALAGIPVRESRAALANLQAIHLLHVTGPARYGRQDLIRLYSAELAAEESPADGEAALDRLLDYYLYTADICWRRLADKAWWPRLPVTRPPDEVPRLPTVHSALHWLEAEESNLHNAFTTASERHQHVRARQLARLLERFHRFTSKPEEPARRGMATARELSSSRSLFTNRTAESPVA